MSQLIHVSDDAYQWLTSLKRGRKASYSQVILEFRTRASPERTETLQDLAASIRSRDKGIKPRAKPIDIDQLLYGNVHGNP